MIGDVKSILGEPQKKDEVSVKPMSLANIGKKSTTRRAESNFKRPEKMHRELYNLIGNAETKEAGAVVPTELRRGFRQLNAQKFFQYGGSVSYKRRLLSIVLFEVVEISNCLLQAIQFLLQLGGRPARKYKWVPFINEARNDSLQLYHWQRVDKLDNPEPYPFAKFNKVINIPDFTDEEYDKYLKVDNWTLEQTRHLFDVCRRFDIRSDPTSEPICFDADHERRRKEQLIKQWNRTKEQLEEEEMLLAELKRIEIRKKEREKKAQDLQKLINMAEAPASPSVRYVRYGAGTQYFSYVRKYFLMDISVSAIRFPEFKSAGAHLRSQEMKLPTNIGQKKLKNIEVVLKKCKLELNPMGSEAIVATYNEFRSQIVLLQELKSTLQTAEFELETLRNRLVEEGKQPFEIENRMRISTLAEGGLDSEELTGEEGAPSTTRRITSYIDTSTATNPLLVRKRKLPPGGNSVELIRTRKN
uniref:SANT domain-containing protein n=1 Tax=Angiostrongylus cantonensis TaxID=6313 RepID=A0A0K0DCD0_ANGCA